MRTTFLVLLAVAIAPYAGSNAAPPEAKQDADIVIVGAGIAGLSAALEAARQGATVSVVEMSSVFGGHAVLSGGGVCIVGTPFQESSKIKDNPEIAYNDFLQWGEDSDSEWARYYAHHSRKEIYDWLPRWVANAWGKARPGFVQSRLHLGECRRPALRQRIYRRRPPRRGVYSALESDVQLMYD